MKFNFYTIIGCLFAVLSIIIYFMANTLAMNFALLMGGNFVLMLVAVLSYYVIKKDVANQNARKFVNKMMASTMIRFFSCLLGITAVIFYFKNTLPHINIFMLMFLYMIYSMVENYFVIKESKKMD
jgi:hypothetical protein